MSGFTTLLMRDLRLVLRRPGDVGVVLAFFVVATVLFPLGIGPETNVLARIAAGVLWSGCLPPITRTARSTCCCWRPGRSSWRRWPNASLTGS
jgi:hypothetical protein